MTRRWMLTALAAACALFAVVGAGRFAEGAERGSPGSGGVALRAVLDRSLDGRANDWYSAVEPGSRTGDGTRLTVSAATPGTQVVSRAVPVRPNRCYRVRVRAQATHESQVLVLDELADETLEALALPATDAPVDVEAVVSSGPERRVTLGLRLPTGGNLVLDSVDIAEAACP